jgi:Matrixin
MVTAALAGFTAAPRNSSLALVHSSASVPPEQRVGLRPGLQLAAMRAAIAAAPEAFAGYNPHCGSTVPVLAYADRRTMAGNFRDQGSGCYVWVNLAQSPLLTAQEICKLALHEMGHLGGLQHSQDPADVMYSPFESDPVPPGCISPLPSSAGRRSSG